ncbi:MAG TPA: hypothetical protein VGX52_03290 [Burkholderiales bacterium]|nr:hypothetical protein [Burkholderiales bacterium]
MFAIVRTQSCMAAQAGGVVESVFTKVFRRAAVKLGGVRELAEFLQEPVETVDHWLIGTIRPPVKAFLRIVDFITSKNPSDPYGH